MILIGSDSRPRTASAETGLELAKLLPRIDFVQNTFSMAKPGSNCAFCRIAADAAAARVVFQDDEVVAFLDHRPLFPGHVLVIPRKHAGNLDDIDEKTLAILFGWVGRIALAVESAMNSEGTFIALNNKVSQSVPHVHVHVVPRNKGDGLRGFFWPRNNYRDDEHADEVQRALEKAISLRR